MRRKDSPIQDSEIHFLCKGIPDDRKWQNPEVQTERFKDNIVRTKEKAEETVSNDINSNEYASNKIKFATDRAFDESVNQFNKQGQKSFMKTKENYQKSKAKIKQLKKKIKVLLNAINYC